jgi:hypothetical protein
MLEKLLRRAPTEIRYNDQCDPGPWILGNPASGLPEPSVRDLLKRAAPKPKKKNHRKSAA